MSIKYILIVLRADDEGEGGTFAIYSLLSRYVWVKLRLLELFVIWLIPNKVQHFRT